jgi:DNA-binding transcriptional LysR family regulator
VDNLLGMKVFVQVVNAGSFVAAAEQVKLSTAMVSRHVLHLENRLGVRLLNRTTRRLSLTDSGRAYYERCAQVLNDLEEAEQAIGETTFTPRGKLRVNCLVSFGSRRLAPLLADYQAKNPQVTIELTLNDRVVDIVEEGYDLAIRAHTEELPASTLIARQISSAHFVVCAAPSYFATHGRPKTPQDLSKHCCLLESRAKPNHWALRFRGQQQEIKITGALISNNLDALRAAALGGLGIGHLPTDVVGEDLAQGRLQPLPQFDPTEMRIYAVYASRRHLSAKVRTFVDFLAERFGVDPPWDLWRKGKVSTKVTKG